LSSTSKTCYDYQAEVSRTEVIDNFFYDINKTITQFLDHWQSHRDEELDDISFEYNKDYRHFDVQEENLYFEITAEMDSKAVIKLEYQDQKEDGLDHVRGKLDKVWERRIETVLERGKK
jgi:hypothetical protein